MLGDKISHYEITGHLGSGGMGEVYRARDTKLGRDVAIKVLPPLFAADTERLARLEREARLIAALNHPHIAAIYGLEDGGPGASRALVLELVEGETLAERLASGPLPLREALAITRQIADALDAAHEKGIVHRDLKPANIKITPAGMVKVLDFGIAKAMGDDPAGTVGSSAVTELNSRGLGILGTAAYMCPEHARGSRVDKRADIWAFGCVLFELLTGTPAFARETTTDTLVRVVEHEPDWTLLPGDVPEHVRALLRRCLAKDPRQRLRDIGDAQLDDTALSGTPGERSARPLRTNLAWLLGGIVIAAAVGFAALSFRPATEAAPVDSVNLRRLTDFVGMEDSPALSPDGKTVAFVARAGGFRQIWLRLLAGGAPLQITHDAIDHEEPRWSPDSTSLIYFTPSRVPGEPGTIWEIAALGGDARRLTTAVISGDISRDGRFLATLQFSGDRLELATLTRNGAETVRTQPLTSGVAYNSVRWSPDGQWFALRRSVEAFDEQVVVVPSTGGEETLIARSSRLQGFSWLGDSSGLVYSSAVGSTVLYPPTRNLRVVGRDGTADRQLTFGDVSYTQPDVLASGAIVATRIRVQSDLWRIPVDGAPLGNTRAAVRITRQTGQAQAPSVSPDGQEIAYLSDSGGHGNVWVTRSDGSATRQITFEQDPNVSIGVPVWSETGAQLAVIVSRDGVTGLSLVRPDGSAFRSIVPNGIAATWSEDDRWLYYATIRNGARCIEKVPPDGGEAVTVRCDDTIVTAVSPDASTLYLIRYFVSTSGVLDSAILAATPEDAEAKTLARVTGTRVPDNARQLVPILSPDGSALVIPLIDGDTTNIWVLPTTGEPMRAVTDFGERAVLIARRVAWAPDGRSVYAAVADTDADIVLLEGLRP